MRNVYNILVGKPAGKIPPEDLRVNGTVILEWIQKDRFEGVEWFRLAQDREKLGALVKTAMNLRVQ
jgi:hypothetical protein